jgi:hypothetical protein
MYKVWLKENWKALFNEEPVDIRTEIAETLVRFGYNTYTDSIGDKIIAIMNISGESVEQTVKSILGVS